MRFPSPNTAWNSAEARKCARRGKRSGVVVFTARQGRRRSGVGSDAEARAALGATTGEDLATVGGLHAGAEAVVAFALEVAGLVGTLGGHDGTPNKWAEKT